MLWPGPGQGLQTRMIPIWAIKPLSYLAMAGAVGAALWFAVSAVEQKGYDRAEQKYLLLMAEERAQAAQDLAEAEAFAREQERAEALRLAEVTAQYDKQMQEASDAYQDIIAGLERGQLRLRREWQGCQASLPGAATAAAEPDDSADLRAAGAGDLVRLADECDARIRALQGVIQ